MVASAQHAASPWQTACELHTTLFNGIALDPVPPPYDGLAREADEQVLGVFHPHGNEPLSYARLLADDVVVMTSRPRVIVGTPHFLAGYGLGSIVSDRRLARKARSLAQPQWRSMPMSCAVVTSRRLWCEIPGDRWWHFGYDHTTSVTLDGDALVLGFTEDAAPLRLQGPWAPWIAVAIAHHRFGRQVTFRLPWLTSIHQATMLV